MIAAPSGVTLVRGLTSQYPALKYEAVTTAVLWESCERRGAIRFAIATFKLIRVLLLSPGREIVPTDQLGPAVRDALITTGEYGG
ncbi:hypothetical protein ACWEKM_03505 [Streptomyces sp. NPDC004752]